MSGDKLHVASDPWPHVVDLAELLDNTVTAIKSFVSLSNDSATACALWVAHAHAFDSADISARLLISSPEKRCGKTTLIAVLSRLAPKALSFSNATTATIFRLIEKEQPTLFLDEADTWLNKENIEIYGILNSGHTKHTASVPRCAPKSHDVLRYSTWCPICIAMIKKPRDTLLDRSIVIVMRRKKSGEKLTPAREKNLVQLLDLQRKFVRWHRDEGGRLIGFEPENQPELHNDRAADSWSHLLAIADLAGGHWPDTARKAAVRVSGSASSSSTQSVETELLRDVHALLVTKREHGPSLEKISSSQLTEELVSNPDLRWGTHNGTNSPLTQKQLSVMLGELGVLSKSIRLGTETCKGFEFRQIEEAAHTWLAPHDRAATTNEEPTESSDTSSQSSIHAGFQRVDPQLAEPSQAQARLS